jgi:hypothetical protein
MESSTSTSIDGISLDEACASVDKPFREFRKYGEWYNSDAATLQETLQVLRTSSKAFDDISQTVRSAYRKQFQDVAKVLNQIRIAYEANKGLDEKYRDSFIATLEKYLNICPSSKNP